jgi:soluble lytic murein transglycosylase-like protein
MEKTRRSLISTTLSAAAIAAGICSYVTLVSLLTQRNAAEANARVAEAYQAARQAALAQEGAMRTAKRLRTTTFVAHIIGLQNPKLENALSLASLIVEESERAEFDPLFVAAVIRSESMFKHGAISHRGAKGLMQLLPSTGKYISEKEKVELPKGHDLHDPATNIRLGIAYLKHLEKRFNGDRERVLLAYNWGPTNVTQYAKGLASPPSSTFSYARTILSAHREWKEEFTQYALALELTEGARLVG